MNEFDYPLCERQQEFFEYAQQKSVNMFLFIEQFMTSEFCNRELDAFYSWFQSVDILEWEEILQETCTWLPDVFTKNKLSYSVSGWIGYIYRLIQRRSNLHSSEIIRLISVKELAKTYEGLHTVDDELAVSILIHDFHIPVKEPNIPKRFKDISEE